MPEVDYPDIEIKDDTTIGAAEENFVNVYKNLTVDENNKHVLHEELVTIPKKEYVDEVAENLKDELGESIVAESNEWKVVDEAGNIIFSVDANGAHTTELILDGKKAATEEYVGDAIANIKIPETDLTDYATKKYVDDAVNGIEIPEVDFTGYATETYVDNKVADLVNSAPEALNTLGELATALENHEDAYDALLETVGGKATKTELEDLKTEISESIVSETTEFHIVDDDGNIIASINENGFETTKVVVDGISVKNKDETLAISDKTIVGAINELNGKISNESKFSKGLAYELSDDETYYIVTGIGDCADTDIIIPSTYEGKPVTAIEDYTFEDCDGLNSVVMPDTMTTIGNYAFTYCTSLTSVVIGDSVTTIGVSTFYGCSSLTSVVIPDSVTSICERAFSGCSSLTSLVIGDSVTSIGNWAFDSCDRLTSVEIPDSVTTIDESVFAFCTGLMRIVIPDSVTSIGNSAFYHCDSLKDVYYTGSEEEWNNISIGSGNESLTNRPIVWGVTKDILKLNEKINTALNKKVDIFTHTLSSGGSVTPIVEIFDAAREAGVVDYSIIKIVGSTSATLGVILGYQGGTRYSVAGVNLETGGYINRTENWGDLSVAEFLTYFSENLNKEEYEELNTEDKTILGAINELVADVGDISRALESIIAQTNTIIGGAE
jgi:hypothetical protein